MLRSRKGDRSPNLRCRDGRSRQLGVLHLVASRQSGSGGNEESAEGVLSVGRATVNQARNLLGLQECAPEKVEQALAQLSRLDDQIASAAVGRSNSSAQLDALSALKRSAGEVAEELRRLQYSAPLSIALPNLYPRPPKPPRPAPSDGESNDKGEESREKGYGLGSALRGTMGNQKRQRGMTLDWETPTNGKGKATRNAPNRRGLVGAGGDRQSLNAGVDIGGTVSLERRGKVVVREARALLGISNPDASQVRDLEEAQAALEVMARELTGAARDARERETTGDSGTAGQAEGLERLLREVEGTAGLLREFGYNLPSAPLPFFPATSRRPPDSASRVNRGGRQGTVVVDAPPKSRRASRGEWGAISAGISDLFRGRPRLPMGLRKMRFEELLATLEPLVKEGSAGLSSGDAATAMNLVKRIRRQARGADSKSRVDALMLRLARDACGGVERLSPREASLALAALADCALTPEDKAILLLLQPGEKVPSEWEEGREYQVGGGGRGAGGARKWERGDLAVVTRTDGSRCFGRVERMEDGRVEVRVSESRDETLALGSFERNERKSRVRFEEAGTLGRLVDARFRTLAERRAAVQELAAHLVRPGVLDQGIPQDAATAAWALARLSLPLRQPLSALQQHVLRPGIVGAAEARDLATLLWAHAELLNDAAPRALFAGLSTRLASTNVLAVCNEQDVATCAWAHGKARLRNAALMRALGQRAVEISPLSAQAASNLLWGMAEVAVLEPDLARSVGDPLARDPAALGAFTTQGAALTLWSHAVLGIPEAPLAQALLAQVARRGTAELLTSDKCQIHQLLLSLSLPELDNSSDYALAALRHECKKAFEENSAAQQRSSEAESAVLETLVELGEECRRGEILPGLGYSIDLWLPARGICVEVDGPSHFVRIQQERAGDVHLSHGALAVPSPVASGEGLVLDGPSLLKHRQLRAAGFRVLSLPFWEWDAVATASPKDRQEWLHARLLEA